jgi:ABC-type antimicrobial peptide transport system permease subunit
LQRTFKPHAEDYGLRFERVSTPLEYDAIVSDQLVLPDEIVNAADRAFSRQALQPVVTYLANTLSVGTGESARKIPYSTITGVDSTPQTGPLLDGADLPIRLADDEIVLNRWAADDLQAKVGDTVTVTFYEPESTHGRLRERQPPSQFKLRAIVELKTADGRPTPAADPMLTPELPGVTDQSSISDWDLPFELVETIRPQDEAYWDEYRTTPKAFVSLATAKRLWASRWGTISLLRLPAGASAAEDTQLRAERLMRELDPASLGMTFLPVKQLGLAAASGTTPFDMLFLGFSFFLMASAVMLIALLFQLGVEQRAREVGTLAAVGIGWRRLVALLGVEGLAVAAIGSTLGIVAGVLYAWLMITGLRTWWLAAIGTPFLQLHVTWRSLIIGWVIGLAMSWLAIGWTIRRLVRVPVGRLLGGSTTDGTRTQRRIARVKLWPRLRIALTTVIILLSVVGIWLQGEAQAGTFFGSGALVLALLLGEIRHRLRGSGQVTRQRGFSITALSAQNTARNPGRSTLTVGLVATASFLIVAISAFRLDTGEAGTGGFSLLATSDQPLHYDLNTAQGRVELGFSDDADRELANWRIFSMRVAAGEDASCLNLYRPTQPRVLGMPQTFIERGGFAWAATASQLQESRNSGNPWSLLDGDLGSDEAGKPVVPVVLDASTAMYSLHLSGVGARLQIRDDADQPVTLEVIGLLKNSVLQGNLIISEEKFLRLYPNTGGYRFFLIERQSSAVPRGATEGSEPEAAHLANTLESTLAEDGFDAVDARDQLAQFLAVQNTYLSTFQSLGALGLLLGTIGLAVVQLRSVLERRGELALMRAAGFRRRRLVQMVVAENGALLLGGLVVGSLAAAVALVPQWLPQQASVPWQTLAVLLGAIAIVGLVAGWLATRSALRAPIVPALRGD